MKYLRQLLPSSQTLVKSLRQQTVIILVMMLLSLGGVTSVLAQSNNQSEGSWWQRITTQVNAVLTVAADTSRSMFSAAVLDIFNPNQVEKPLATRPIVTSDDGLRFLPTTNPAQGSLVFNTPVFIDNTLSVSEALRATTAEFQSLQSDEASLNTLAAALAELTSLVVTNTATIAELNVSQEATITALTVAELARLAELEVSGNTALGEVTVAASSTFAGRLTAAGGIDTLGATVDLGVGELFAANVVNAVEAGDNVVITGSQNRPVVSVVTDDLVGVLSLNEETGSLKLKEGTDIQINGLEIDNRSTLTSVVNRGGCFNCIQDNYIEEALTISGGTINNSVIGLSTPAAASFTTTTVTSLLTVSTTATSTFAGSINITGGCFAVNGNCIGGAAPSTYIELTDTPNSLLAGAVQFASTSGSSLVQSSAFVFDGSNLGLGTSSPSSLLTVAGDMYVTGAWRDGGGIAGNDNDLLVSTGTSTRWAAAAEFGLGDGTYLGLSDTLSAFTANRIPFTNSSSTALTDSSNLLFDGTNLAIGSPLLAVPLAVSAQSGTTSALFWGNTNENKIAFANSTLTDFATIGILNGGLALSGSPSITSPDLIINNSGRVGIGDSTPNFKLEVEGTSGFGYFAVSSANLAEGDVFVVDTTGNVGVGTTTPASTLSVVGDVYVTGAWRDGGGAAGADGDLLVSTGTSTRWADATEFGLGDGTYIGLTDTPGAYLANAIQYATSAANALTQASDFVYTGSRLGVGTDAPVSAVTVRGDISALDTGAVRFYDNDSSDFVGFRASTSLATSTVWTLPVADGSTNQLLVTDGAGNLLFEDISAVGGGATTYLGLTDTPSVFTSYSIPFVNATGTALSQASNFVFRNDRLGLGVSNPNSKLVVQGDVRFQTADARAGLFYNTISNQTGFGTANPTELVTVQGGSFTQRGGVNGNTYSPIMKAGITLPSNTNDIAMVGDYAYAVTGSTGDDFHVIDISNPLNPVAVASAPLPAGATAVAVAGRYAYVTTEVTGNDFHVIDISNPLDPIEVAGLNLPSTANTVAIQGRYAYVGTDNIGTDFHVIDISNPLAPFEVDSIDMGDSVNGIAVAGQFAYVVTSVQGNDFHVIDISDPTKVVELDSLDLPDTANAIDVVGRYAYVTTNSGGNDFHIIDVSNPLSLVETGSLNLATAANDVVVTGRYAYVVTQALGNDFYVIDMLEATAPAIIGEVDYAFGNMLAVTIEGRYAYVGSSNTGSTFHIIDISGAEVQSLVAQTLAAGELTVRGDTMIAGTLTGGLGIRAGIEGVQTDGTLSVLGSSTSFIAGRLGIGTTTPSAKLTVAGTIQATNLFGGAVGLETDANGNIIRAVSDARLKENVTDIEGALAQVLQLRGVRYQWIDTKRFGSQTEIGFLAQEVDEIVPEVVRKGGEYWSLNTRNLLAVVVEAIQELWQIVQGNQSEIELLRERVQQLEAVQSDNESGMDSPADVVVRDEAITTDTVNESADAEPEPAESTTATSSSTISSSTATSSATNTTVSSPTITAATTSGVDPLPTDTESLSSATTSTDTAMSSSEVDVVIDEEKNEEEDQIMESLSETTMEMM